MAVLVVMIALSSHDLCPLECIHML